MTDDQNAVSYTGKEHRYNVAYQYRNIPEKKSKTHSNSLTSVPVSVKPFGWQGKCRSIKATQRKHYFIYLRLQEMSGGAERLCFLVLQEAAPKLLGLQVRKETVLPDNKWPKRGGSHPAPKRSPNTKLATRAVHPLL